MSSPQVLIVGAGPTGLVLACELAWRGVAVRIVDRAGGPADESRALGVHARTLELLEPHATAEMLRRGLAIRGMNTYDGTRRLAHVGTDAIESAHAYVLSLPQSETERQLAERLRQLGVDVAWRTEAAALETLVDRVRVTLRSAAGEEDRVEASWVVGCDGARSFVREALGLPFKGERYPVAFNLADLAVDMPLADDEPHVFLSTDGVLLFIPLPEPGHFRMVASESRGSAAENRADPTLEDLKRWLRQRAGAAAERITLGEPIWTSRFRIHRRLVPTLRAGRVLLAGDAAHVHSPVGGQGMNNGVYDAVNLGWKLALVAAGRADPVLLDSYHAERHAEARAILRGTHWLTRFATLQHPAAHAVRASLTRLLFNRRFAARRLVRQISGTEVHYRGSPIVTDEAGILDRLRHRGAPRPGERAPDVRTAPDLRYGAGTGRLYDAFDHPGHTLLLFPGDDPTPAETVGAVLRHSGIDVRPVVVTDAAARARYRGDAFPLYLIRPDRHVGFRGRQMAPGPVLRHVEAMLGRTTPASSFVVDVVF